MQFAESSEDLIYFFCSRVHDGFGHSPGDRTCLLSDADITGAMSPTADITAAMSLAARRATQRRILGANRSDANLTVANLSQAQLGGAMLARAILKDAKFKGAIDAGLGDAVMESTTLPDGSTKVATR